MTSEASIGEPLVSLAYLSPTPRQTRSALAWAAALLVGFVVLMPFVTKPLPLIYGFIPALDATLFVTDLITASLLFTHFSTTRSRALLVLACGYLFSAAMVVAHGVTFPGPFSEPGYLGQRNHFNFRIYLLWHLGLPAALFAYLWLRDRERPKVGRTSTALVLTCCAVAVLALASCTVWLAVAGASFLPSALTSTSAVVSRWLTGLVMLTCAAALSTVWLVRRSVLDQWLMVVMLASILELAITSLIGGLASHATLGFYTGRLFSLVTSTVVLAALLAETTILYAQLAHANMLASVVSASQTLSGEIELPKLIERLMTIALENAGAAYGMLILPAGNEYIIQAEARANDNRVEVVKRQEPLTGSACPEPVVRNVIHTKERVVLHDLSEPNLPKSILCLPLLKQRELIGILLLESTGIVHFSAARIAALELVAAQAAISLENSRLYSDLQEREAKVRRLIDSNFIGILIGDRDGQIQEANQAFLQIVGYDQADVQAGRLRRTELTPAEWHERDAQGLAEMKTIGTCQPYEKEYLRKDGSRVPVLVGGATFGEMRFGIVAFIVDLSERKNAEAELAHANRVATMGQLTASIAHEVSQPVTGLLLNAQTAVLSLAAQPPNVEAARSSIDRIIRDGKLTADIVSRIRDFSRKAPARKRELELNEAISEIIGLTRVQMTNSGVSLKMQLAGGLPHILGDRVQLQQVILNLIMNAIEAMSEVREGSRELSVSTRGVEPDGVLVAVRDSGPGLPPANYERIFEAFYTTKSSGLGLGLSICRTIVETHGGRLWAEPNGPCGAAFCFTLPSQVAISTSLNARC